MKSQILRETNAYEQQNEDRVEGLKGLVISGDAVYNNTHPYLAECNEQARGVPQRR